MKKIFVCFIVCLCFKAKAQITEGSIKFAMKVDGNQQDIAAQMLSNTTVTIYFKKDKALMEMNTPAYNMRTLTDNSGVLLLMDAAGQKFYSKKTKEDLAKEKLSGKSPEPTIVYSNESKKILGYDCKKAFLTIQSNRGMPNKMTIWCTDKIRNVPGLGPINAEALAKLKGMALEVEMDQAGIKSRMTATEISTKTVADATFILSTNGYAERKVPGTAPIKR